MNPPPSYFGGEVTIIALDDLTGESTVYEMMCNGCGQFTCEPSRSALALTTEGHTCEPYSEPATAGTSSRGWLRSLIRRRAPR